MAFGKGKSSTTITDLYNRVSDMTLLLYYFGIDVLPCTVNAPYRNDNNPSVGIYLKKNGRAGFVDFASGESGGIVDLLAKTWNVTLDEVTTRINIDVPKMLNKIGGTTIKPTTSNRRIESSDTLIQCKYRDWKDYDIKFWESYGISKPWLEFGNVFPISRIFITKCGQMISFPAEKFAYAYVERKDDKVTVKIYQPLSERIKWLNNHDSSVWDLWSQLPEKGENLIITSSRKDALCIWENSGIPSVSLQGEGYIPKPHVMQQLIDRFTNVYVLYDNDFTSEINHGHLFSSNICSKFGLKQLEIPEEYQAKDPSDFCKKYGRQKTYDLIYNLIKNQKQ